MVSERLFPNNQLGCTLVFYSSNSCIRSKRSFLSFSINFRGSKRPLNHKWYAIEMEDLWQMKVDGVTVNILSAPCYLASKFEAFNSRGSEYRTSYDFEDIIYVVDNRTIIVEEIKNTNILIREFLKIEFRKINSHYSSEEIYTAHIHPLIVQDLLTVLIAKVNKIL